VNFVLLVLTITLLWSMAGGWYHGVLRFPSEYPMKVRLPRCSLWFAADCRCLPEQPPAVLMLTPSGRFEINKKICMSMSDFHPETWNPMWSVSTILVGLLSFMVSCTVSC
jgi:ubiquitin-conjugating enzyme E2 J2